MGEDAREHEHQHEGKSDGRAARMILAARRGREAETRIYVSGGGSMITPKMISALTHSVPGGTSMQLHAVPSGWISRLRGVRLRASRSLLPETCGMSHERSMRQGQQSIPGVMVAHGKRRVNDSGPALADVYQISVCRDGEIVCGA